MREGHGKQGEGVLQSLVEVHESIKKTSNETTAGIVRIGGSCCEHCRNSFRHIDSAEKGARGERGSFLFSADYHGHRLLPLPRHLDTRHQGKGRIRM